MTRSISFNLWTQGGGVWIAIPKTTANLGNSPFASVRGVNPDLNFLELWCLFSFCLLSMPLLPLETTNIHSTIDPFLHHQELQTSSTVATVGNVLMWFQESFWRPCSSLSFWSACHQQGALHHAKCCWWPQKEGRLLFSLLTAWTFMVAFIFCAWFFFLIHKSWSKLISTTILTLHKTQEPCLLDSTEPPECQVCIAIQMRWVASDSQAKCQLGYLSKMSHALQLQNGSWCSFCFTVDSCACEHETLSLFSHKFLSFLNFCCSVSPDKMAGNRAVKAPASMKEVPVSRASRGSPLKSPRWRSSSPRRLLVGAFISSLVKVCY